MKRFLVALLTIGLIAGSLAAPAAAGKKKKKKNKKPKRIEREVQGAYDAPTPVIIGLCAQTGAVGCVEFGTGPGEKYITELKITDQHGLPVYGSIQQDTDGDNASDHTVGDVCGELTEPLEIVEGVPVIVWISAPGAGMAGCVPAEGTTGTVDVTLSNMP